MLVIERKLNEQILIGGGITITVTQIRRDGSRVRLGIDAPPDVVISRPDYKPKPRQTALERRGDHP